MTIRSILPNFTLLLACFLIHMPAQEATAQDFAAPLKTITLEDGDNLVFLGDSITHQCLYTQYVETFFYTRYPNLKLNFHNAGVGGARAWDALARMERDVLSYKPKYVTILLGMNDGSYQPYNEAVFQTYRSDMTKVIEQITKSGAKPILMTPTMFDSRAARMGKRKRDAEMLALYNSVLSFYGVWLQEVATENGHGFVNMYAPLNQLTIEQRKTDPKFTLIRDAVHPDAPGQLVMAAAIIDQMGLRKPLSNVRLVVNANGKVSSRVSGGTIENVNLTDAVISFEWTANGLPFVVPPEAELGAKLLHLGHRYTREGLEIHSLPAGRYELSIDDVVVGTYTNQQLARHIELQSNPKTPQYQQAMAVAILNKKRNEGPVKSLRNEWRSFQSYARMKRDLENGTVPEENRESVQKRVQNLEPRIKAMDSKIAEFEQQASEIESQIRRQAQPVKRKFTLKRVDDEKPTGKTTVNGKVTLNGKPLPNAKVVFKPRQGKEVPPTATTDEEGKFELKQKTPVKPGVYRVQIQTQPPKEEKPETPQGNVIPRKYASPSRLPLVVQIREGENTFQFELKN